MNINQLIERLPEEVVRELVGTFAFAHFEEAGFKSPEGFLLALLQKLYPQNCLVVDTLEQLDAALTAASPEEAKEAVARLKAEAALTKAAAR